MKLFYVRHGQTDWNLGRFFQGSSDTPLNDTGRAQAGQAAEALKDEHIDVVYVSPLSRARETAAIINRCHGAPTIADGRLAERCFGDLEGKPIEQAVHDHIWTYNAPNLWGEEPLPAFFHRVYDFLDSLKGRSGTALIAAHGGVSACVRSYLEHIPPERISPTDVNILDLLLKNGEVLRFELE